MQKITGTKVRTPEMMRKYYEVSNERKAAKSKGEFIPHPFANILDKNIISFNYWVIINNDFPYDAIANVSHMILPKRKFSFDWKLMNAVERAELDQLKQNGYISKNYDVIWENLPIGQTIPGRFHLHLLKLKRYEIKKES